MIKKLSPWERKKNRDESKRKSTLYYAIDQVKENARQDCWCSIHNNCFKATFGKGESKKHRDLKYERWCYWREFGATVFTEVRWKNGSRSDLVVCLNNGEIFIEEILVSESNESIEKKKGLYPFELRTVRCNDTNR